MRQLTFFDEDENLINLRQACEWASQYLKREVTVSNISYLLQYGRIKNYGSNGNPLINIEELKQYYDSYDKKEKWKDILGDDLDWHLSFEEYKESERTKHVHRLHPYKGKFIPQLVEYFLDSHTDEFKKEVYFNKGDIILDPFCGSGTTLVQSNELGIHALGIDISMFNAMISNVKVRKHDIKNLKDAIDQITIELKKFQNTKNNITFEKQLLFELTNFNNRYFPSPEYKRRVRNGEIDEKKYSIDKEIEFLKIYYNLVKKYNIRLEQDNNKTFLDKWFLYPVREEIDFVVDQIKRINDKDIGEVLTIILSRTARSCRATTYADLATLKEPVRATYYCKKHGKICKPIFSIMGWWQTYTIDTIKRLIQFERLRTETFQICLVGDSRKIDIFDEVKKKNQKFGELLLQRKVNGIFSSPPYVGLIDYHDQHAYAYEMFGFDRKDELEIGPLYKGQGKEARDSYIKGIAESLNNCKKYLKDDYDIFLVANDKFNLYPEIARLSQMRIVNLYKRPVLNRSEKDRSNAYMETIFHLKEI